MGFRDKFMAKSPFKAGHMSAAKAGNMKSPVNEGKKSAPTQDRHSMAKKADPYAEALKKDSKLPEYIKQRKGLKKGTSEYAKVQNKINAAYGVSKRHSEKPASTTTTKPASDKVQLKPTVKAPSAGKPANAGGGKKKVTANMPAVEVKAKADKRIDKRISKAVEKGKTEKAARLSARASQPGETGLERRLNYKGQKARERKAARQEKRANKNNNK